MTEHQRWRLFISIWVAALCVSAIICCLLLTQNQPLGNGSSELPPRYQYLHQTQGEAVGPGQALIFDRATGTTNWTDFGQPFGVIKQRAKNN
jgi:hypothetical protein